jgi:hypothetical protein
MFTTEASSRAMLDPTMVATNVSRLRLCDRAASTAGVVAMIPASHGARVNPIIVRLEKGNYRRLTCMGIIHQQEESPTTPS